MWRRRRCFSRRTNRAGSAASSWTSPAESQGTRSHETGHSSVGSKYQPVLRYAAGRYVTLENAFTLVSAESRPDAGPLRVDHPHRARELRPDCDEDVVRQGSGLEVQAELP